MGVSRTAQAAPLIRLVSVQGACFPAGLPLHSPSRPRRSSHPAAATFCIDRWNERWLPRGDSSVTRGASLACEGLSLRKQMFLIARPEGDDLDGGGLGHDVVHGCEPVGRLEGETFRRVDPTELIWFQWNGPRLTVVSSRCSCRGPSLAPRCVSRGRARSSDAGSALAKNLVFRIEGCYI